MSVENNNITLYLCKIPHIIISDYIDGQICTQNKCTSYKKNGYI